MDVLDVLDARDRGRPYAVDDGHFILECRFPNGIVDAEAVGPGS